MELNWLKAFTFLVRSEQNLEMIVKSEKINYCCLVISNNWFMPVDAPAEEQVFN